MLEREMSYSVLLGLPTALEATKITDNVNVPTVRGWFVHVFYKVLNRYTPYIEA